MPKCVIETVIKTAGEKVLNLLSGHHHWNRKTAKRRQSVC